MDENDLICWHYDHCQGRNVKGINLLNCLYHANGTSLPVAFDLVHKPIHYCDIKTRQEKRRSQVTQNEQMRAMVDAYVQNWLKFSWILADIGFTSTETMEHLKQTRQKDFIMALKGNRLVALGEADRKNGHHTGLDPLQWPEQKAVTGWLKGLDFPSGLSGESLQTRKAAAAFCIWPVASGKPGGCNHHDLPKTVESGGLP